MILFWVICIAMLSIALLYVLPPALQAAATKATEETARRNANIAIYRDQLSELEDDLRNGIISQEQYAQDHDDIERRLLEDTTTEKTPSKPVKVSADARKHAYMLGVGLALVAVIFYLRVGTPAAVTGEAAPTIANAPSAPPMASGGQRSQEQIEASVAALAKRLQSNPSDAQGWSMLARSYTEMGRWGEAAGAYAKLTELTPNDADLWAEYAFAVAMASGRKLDGKPMELIDHALKIDPNNPRALGLAANAAYDKKDYQKAIDYWQRIMKQMPADAEIAKTLQSRIDEAKAKQNK
ncbi:MAG TPA: c-type cytochrome biogenesis protein CcmI [Pyrinomonadaceae bacterium]|nr:c-type cytochrome biogenesis protein CcmI [Pyrinomonadaceae bacterium]